MLTGQITSAILGIVLAGAILFLVRRDHLHGPYAVWWFGVAAATFVRPHTSHVGGSASSSFADSGSKASSSDGRQRPSPSSRPSAASVNPASSCDGR